MNFLSIICKYFFSTAAACRPMILPSAITAECVGLQQKALLLTDILNIPRFPNHSEKLLSLQFMNYKLTCTKA